MPVRTSAVRALRRQLLVRGLERLLWNLVKLNLRNWHVCDYPIDAVGMWMDQFHIDGICFDAADCVDFDPSAGSTTSARNAIRNSGLMGEIIHGDYKVKSGNAGQRDQLRVLTGIYSSHNDKNYLRSTTASTASSATAASIRAWLCTTCGQPRCQPSGKATPRPAVSALCYTLLYWHAGHSVGILRQ